MPREKISDTVNTDDLAKLFDIPTWDDISERNDYSEAYSAGRREALKEGLSEDEADEQGQKWEQAEQDEGFNKWHDGLMHVAEELFGQHNLELTPKGKHGGKRAFEFKVSPTKSWTDSAAKIVETINGVGQFEFRGVKDFMESGPYTAREAVLHHLHQISNYPEVYGGGSASSMYDRYVR